MKKVLFATLFSLSLSACGAAPQIIAPPAAPLLRANTPQVNANYTFRKPIASLYLDFYVSSDKEQGLELFKEFVRKYLDDNDIVNYQIVEQNGGNDIVTINIFGGNKEAVSQKILPDVLYYLRQRVRFDKAYVTTP